MKSVLVTLLCFGFALPVAAAERRAAVAAPNTRIAHLRGDKQPVSAATPKAVVSSADQIFPFFATGGGWESIVTLTNMSRRAISYRLSFFSREGRPINVTFRELDGRVTSASAIEGRLPENGGDNFVLFDNGALVTGWAAIDYDTNEGRIGGSLLFRQRVSGRPDFESIVSLSRDDDFVFFMPFDNLDGFATTLAITNTAANATSTVRLIFYDLDGVRLRDAELRLPPGSTESFSLRERYPDLDRRAGQVYVEASTDLISAIGLRFNPAGAFVSVPIVNWDGI